MAQNYNGAEAMDYNSTSPFTYPEDEYLGAIENRVKVGQATMLRDAISAGTLNATTGQLRLTYFTAYKSETAANVRMISGGTAAAATPTLCRIGLYKEEADGSLTLIASTVNDTALFSTIYTAYTKAFSSPVAVTAGQRYAIGVITVSGVATATLSGTLSNIPTTEFTIDPRLTAYVNAQADLITPIAVGSLAASGSRFYAVITP